MNNPDPLNTFRQVIGGKVYDKGNYVYLMHRSIYIEFDSDYTLSYPIKSKNWRKKAKKILDSIPNPVSLKELQKIGFNIPTECFRYE